MANHYNGVAAVVLPASHLMLTHDVASLLLQLIKRWLVAAKHFGTDIRCEDDTGLCHQSRVASQGLKRKTVKLSITHLLINWLSSVSSKLLDATAG